MFHAIGHAVARRGGWLIVAWAVLLVTVWRSAPEWSSVAKPGEFDFLPDYTTSRQGQKLLAKAFPNEVLGSSAVLVVQRDGLACCHSSVCRAPLCDRLAVSDNTRLRDVTGGAGRWVGAGLRLRHARRLLEGRGIGSSRGRV